MSATVGFLSVRQHSEHGYFGGYLAVNRLGRPLEFQCTMPVKPSRAQQLLYGRTIDDFVCGEQIAKALTAKTKIMPDLLLTDCSAALAICTVTKVPIALLCETEQSEGRPEFLSTPQTVSIQQQSVQIGESRFALPIESQLTEQTLTALLEEMEPKFELAEPFQRVIEALLEAHPIAKAA